MSQTTDPNDLTKIKVHRLENKQKSFVYSEKETRA